MTTEQTDTFPKLLRQNAALRGEKPAIREKRRGIWRTMTWQELRNEAVAVAAALASRDVTRGTRVGLVGDNRPRLYVMTSAIQWLGAVAVPLYQDATAEELVEPIQKAGITHLFAENQEQVDKLLAILPRCPTVRCIVFDKDRGMRHYRQPQLVSYADLLQEGCGLAEARRSLLDEELSRGRADEPAFVFFTAGTMGPPKGVVLTHGAMIDRARSLAAADGLTDRDVAIAYLPPAWLGQTLFSYAQPMATGHSVCCPESSDTLLADMREIAPTCFVATPRVLEALLAQISTRMDDTGGVSRALYAGCRAVARRSPDGKPVSGGDRLISAAGDILINGPLRDMIGLSRTRAAYTAGDAAAPDLFLFFRSLGIDLRQLYGSTETGFVTAMQRRDAAAADSVGPAADGVELKIAQDGEILVRSPGLFSEYLGDPSATSAAMNGDGWLHTGDAGFIGPDGQLRIVDRIQNIGSLADGSPFSPKAIENSLKLVPYIKEAVVIGNGRDQVCALIDLDGTAAGRWADNRAISYTGHADLASRDEIYDMIAESVGGINAGLRQTPALAPCQVHRFAILPSELGADSGLLTRTGKLRRDVISARFRALIEAMYAGQSEAPVEDPGSGEAAGSVAAVKIRDAKGPVAAQVRRAA